MPTSSHTPGVPENLKNNVPQNEDGADKQAIPKVGEAEVEPRPIKKGCCSRFCGAIIDFLNDDVIHGSLIGPNSPSFLIWCKPCKKCCKPTCIRPCSVASISTKAMYFIMMCIIALLSCFFIYTYPRTFWLEPISGFYPCTDKKVNSKWKTCDGQGGYFMVYRNFFALTLFLFIMSLLTINIKSSGKNYIRSPIHHGFWLYKFAVLFAFLMIGFLGIRVAEGGIFEIIFSSFGLASAVFFSVAQITFILDIIEIWVIKNKSSVSDWKDCLYWTLTGLVGLLDLFILANLCLFYSISSDESKQLCLVNIILLGYAVLMSVCMIGVHCVPKWRKKFEHTGFLQSMFMILHTLVLTWSAMGNTIWENKTQCKPVWHPYGLNEGIIKQNVNPGSWDVYFTTEGLTHGITVMICLSYYCFWNGPRTSSAPLSIAFNKIMYRCAKKPIVPVIQDTSETTEEQLAANQDYKVWDDEKEEVTYSWTLFHVFLIFGSMTLCMAMTNFSNPWTGAEFSSSWPALGVKMTTSFITVCSFLLPMMCPSRCIYPDSMFDRVPKPDEEAPLVEVGENKNKDATNKLLNANDISEAAGKIKTEDIKVGVKSAIQDENDDESEEEE